MDNKLFQVRAAMLLALVMTCVVLYGPTKNHNFILLDDDVHIYKNPDMQQPSLEGVAQYWQKPFFGLFIPVTYTVWSVQALFARDFTEEGIAMEPHVFHLTNIAFHIINTLLAFWVIGLFVPNIWGAFLGAMLFAIHPMQVEPVAWVAGQRDLLSGMFSFLAMGLFVISFRKGKEKVDSNYVAATLCYVLGLLSKPSTVVVPLCLLAILGLWEGKAWKPLARKLFLWILLAIPTILITKGQQLDTNLTFVPTWPERFAVAADTLVFYAMKLVLPYALAIDYGRSPEWLMRSQVVYFTALIPVVVALFIYVYKIPRRQWALPAAMAISLSPMLGFVPFAYQQFSTVADHYMYFTMVIVGIVLADWIRTTKREWAMGATAVVLGALFVKSAVYIPMWRNTERLFEYTIKETPHSQTASNNLGYIRERQGRHAEALHHYTVALNARPKWQDARYNVGNILAKLDRIDEADKQIRTVLAQNPDHKNANHVMGMIYMTRGDNENAAKYLEKASALNIQEPLNFVKLGAAYTMLNRLEDAMVAYRKALDLNPKLADGHNNLGVTLQRMKDFDGAIASFNNSLKVDPNYMQARANLAGLLAQRDRCMEAQPHFEILTRAMPREPSIRLAYANCLKRLGRKQESIEQYSAVLMFDPKNAEARQNGGRMPAGLKVSRKP